MNNLNEYKGVWVLAEQHEGRLLPVSFELLTRGIELAGKRGCELAAVVMGNALAEDELQKLILHGADKVIAAEAAGLENFLIEPYSRCFLKIIDDFKPEIVIAGATSTGRSLMPYAAMNAYTGLTADCTLLDIDPETGNLLQTRPAIGGNIMATIKCPEFRPQMATVRPKSTRQAPAVPGRSGEIVRIKMSAGLLDSRIKRTGFIADEDEINLQDAEKVVVVGRGIKKAENLYLVKELAAALGAALGATRDVVDRGWMSYPHQIGLSGKTVTPKLYIGVGVSGAIQHLAGMQTAETIVAINRDPDAQIFKVADFGIVGDLFEVLPVLTEKIRREGMPW